MSGGSQHNPNGRQAQLGAGWSPLQLQVANLLARAPQAHMVSERGAGVTWHTPTPPHLYHVPAPSPPDPLQGLLQLQAMKGAGPNSVFRHTATPPELYRHTPTPPDKHLMRHTPSPGDVKAAATLPSGVDIYPLGPARDKLVRAEELLAYARGVDLSIGTAARANGAPNAHSAQPALSVRDAPTINSLIARAQPRHGPGRVDALLERLSAPAPPSPHSVIVPPPRAAHHTPSPPSSNEDSLDSSGSAGGAGKRKRKPERTVRLPTPSTTPTATQSDTSLSGNTPPGVTQGVTQPDSTVAAVIRPVENGAVDKTVNGPVVNEVMQVEQQKPPPSPPLEAQPPPEPTARRKTRSGSSETIDDIAAMIASTDKIEEKPTETTPEPETPVSIDVIKSVLASPEPDAEKVKSPMKDEENKEVIETAVVEAAAAPKRRSARISNSESTNVPVESPSEAKPAEPEASEVRSAEPIAASFVEVENQLEKMFAGIEEDEGESKTDDKPKAKKRRKSAPAKEKGSRRGRVAEERRKAARKKGMEKGKKAKERAGKDAYDSGSNASSSRSRGPYIQIRGPRDSPLSVNVVNATASDEERRRTDDYKHYRGVGRQRRGLHASTLGLRYDATTPDATWRCVFCEKGPHHAGLGDLFGPYTVGTDCDEYRALDEATRHRHPPTATHEVWFHEECAVWAPGLLAAGARLWGLCGAVWGVKAAVCGHCGESGAPVCCAERPCRAAAHLPCAKLAGWALAPDTLTAHCPRHA